MCRRQTNWHKHIEIQYTLNTFASTFAFGTSDADCEAWEYLCASEIDFFLIWKSHLTKYVGTGLIWEA